MRLEISARREENSQGKSIHADLKLNGIKATAAGTTLHFSGDNREYIEGEYMGRVYHSYARGGPNLKETRYEGEIFLSSTDILRLFAEFVNSAAKSDEFKALCSGIINELQRKKPRKNYRITTDKPRRKNLSTT